MGGEFLLIHFFEQLSHQCINGCAQSSLVRHIFLIIQKFESLNTNLVREGVISPCLISFGVSRDAAQLGTLKNCRVFRWRVYCDYHVGSDQGDRRCHINLHAGKYCNLFE